MRTITIELAPEADFSFEMAGIREWLDKHRCAPTSFKYDQTHESVIIQVEFAKEEEVEVLKRYFDTGRDDLTNYKRPRPLVMMEWRPSSRLGATVR